MINLYELNYFLFLNANFTMQESTMLNILQDSCEVISEPKQLEGYNHD